MGLCSVEGVALDVAIVPASYPPEAGGAEAVRRKAWPAFIAGLAPLVVGEVEAERSAHGTTYAAIARLSMICATSEMCGRLTLM